MKTLRRFVWYLAGRLALVILLLGLCTVTFYYAMNTMNVYIVLKDGMAARAQVIMMDADETSLAKFFQPAYLQRDENLQNALAGKSPYSNYAVRGIDHRLELTWMWCWPWEQTARAEFTEAVPRIDGRIKPGLRESALSQYGESALSPPKWQRAKYAATMVKEGGQWRVRNILLKENLE